MIGITVKVHGPHAGNFRSAVIGGLRLLGNHLVSEREAGGWRFGRGWFSTAGAETAGAEAVGAEVAR